jgi:hypothetical protein
MEAVLESGLIESTIVPLSLIGLSGKLIFD